MNVKQPKHRKSQVYKNVKRVAKIGKATVKKAKKGY